MKKMKKYLKFINIKLQLDQQHPKDISRVHLKLIQSNQHSQNTQQKQKHKYKTTQDNHQQIQQNQQSIHQQNSHRFYKTKQYAKVTPTTLQWLQDIQIPYNSQQCLKFQTICQHEYAYQIEQLKALYSGTLYLKPQQFFKQLTAHVFNQQGIKCGIFRFIIKVVEKQIALKKAQQKQIVQEEVKVQLVGKITLYGAILKNTALTFNTKKHKLGLKIAFGNIVIDGGINDNKWSFPGKKIQVMDNSPKYVHLTLYHQGNTALAGVLETQQIQRNKRFISQDVQMFDIKNQKIGTVQLDIRYLNKKQLLDLMYSPKQLTDNHIELSALSARPHRSKPQLINLWRKKDQINEKTKDILPVTNQRNPQQSTSLSPEKLQKHLEAQKLRKMLNRSSLGGASLQLKNNSNRYKKVYIINSHNELKIPQAKRWVQKPSLNPNLSYIDPDKLSFFSSKDYGKKGYMIPHSQRQDFTKVTKNFPGVGDYHLPSIWQKY